MNKFYLKVKKLKEFAGIDSPAKKGDAGFDVHCPERIVLHPWQKMKIPLGIAIEFPQGWLCRVENKSGIASKTGLYNVGGIIDSEFRGEVGAIVYNFSDNIEVIEKGQKLCQFVFYKIDTTNVEYVDELSDTERGENGFGSTGL